MMIVAFQKQFLDCFKRFMTGNPSRTPLQVENNVRPRPGTVKFFISVVIHCEKSNGYIEGLNLASARV